MAEPSSALLAQVQAMDPDERIHRGLEALGSTHRCEGECIPCACAYEIQRRHRGRMATPPPARRPPVLRRGAGR